ncbi:MAG TPA: hypothetical protein VEO54_29660 [Thermoanaerobaculia bacterium]|nr:hypothetical protein [Thermoanaerobaculia bacterium]
MLSRWGTVAAVLAVLAAYVYFGSGRTWAFPRVPWERSQEQQLTERYYAGLAESFLRGRLDLPYPVDARWKNVTNAYDFAARDAHGLAWEMWDASYYNGRFYLYFSPVPAILFYIPFRLVGGGYPSDALAATFFLSWAFLASVAFLRRAEARPTWILLIGLGNVGVFVLGFVRAYEVAVTAGMAMTAMFAYALLRWFQTGATKHAVWAGVWLALAMATRPNLIVLGVLLPVVLWKHRRALLLALLPLMAVGGAMMLYNYARFSNPFELGMTYQISYEPLWRAAPCSLCDVPTAMRFVNNTVHYVFWAPRFAGQFPYVFLQNHALDRPISFAGGAEPILGIAALSPLTLLGSFLALALLLRRGANGRGVQAALAVMACAWLVLFGLSTCRWVTARYALDFMLLMTVAAVVCVEEALGLLAPHVRTRALSLALGGVALYTIATALLLGFRT